MSDTITNIPAGTEPDNVREQAAQQTVEYTDDNIRHLSDMEHVRTRPGM